MLQIEAQKIQTKWHMVDSTYIKIQATAKALTNHSYEMNSNKTNHCKKGSVLSLFEQTDSDEPVLIRFLIFSRVILFG